MELTDRNHIKSLLQEECESGGFNFDLQHRNDNIFKTLGGKANVLPSAWKTGTTIVGIVYKDGVVLGADI